MKLCAKFWVCLEEFPFMCTLFLAHSWGIWKPKSFIVANQRSYFSPFIINDKNNYWIIRTNQTKEVDVFFFV